MLDLLNKASSCELIVRNLIKLLGIKVTNTSIRKGLLNHPDYPSILSVADVLKQWNIDNAIIKVDKHNLSQVPLPFIAHTNKNEFQIIISVSKNEISFTNETGVLKTQSVTDFIEIWSGIVLVAEKTENSGEKNYTALKRIENWNNLKTPLFFVGLTISFILLAVKGFGIYNNDITNSYYFLFTGILKIAGLVVATLLLWYEIDKANPVLQKICTAGAKTNCSAILSGKKSKLFSWLSWSEVGFFYFIGTFLFLIFNYSNPSSLLVIVVFNMLTLYYPFFSIYYQWRVAKQWCVLCLATQAILVLEFLVSLSMGKLNTIFQQNSYNKLLHQFVEPTFIVSFLLPILLWFFIKPFLLQAQENNKNKRALMRLKYDTRIFNALLPKQKKLEYDATGLGIQIGNPNAENTIIKVCNPYCGPCATAHPEIEAILENNPNVKAQIIFTATNSTEDRRSYPVKHLLAIAAKQNEVETKNSLDDWYLAPQKNYEIFKLKYPMNGELEKQGDKIDKMNEWCKKVDIQFTPTIFINGYQIPEVYEIKDLKYLLS